jgi:hypothetical protein
LKPAALAFLAGCNGAAKSDRGSPSAAAAEKAAPTLPEADTRKTGYLHTGDENAALIQWAKTDWQIKGQMGLKRECKTDSG